MKQMNCLQILDKKKSCSSLKGEGGKIYFSLELWRKIIAFTLVNPELSNQPTNRFKLMKYVSLVLKKMQSCAMTEFTSTHAVTAQLLHAFRMLQFL